MSAPAAEILGAMITPAVLISASGTLTLSTANRLSRVVDRVRILAREAQEGREAERLQLVHSQLRSLSRRIVLLRTAMTALYSAIGLLVGSSIAIGIVATLQWRYGWAPILLGLLGAGALFTASILLVREARLAVGSTLEELEFVKRLTQRHEN